MLTEKNKTYRKILNDRQKENLEIWRRTFNAY